MLGYLIRRAIALHCFILVSLGLSQRCDFNPWKTNIFRKEYDHIRRRPKIFEEASKISELDMEAMKVLLPYTLMLSPVSLFFQTSPGRGVGKLRPKEP